MMLKNQRCYFFFTIAMILGFGTQAQQYYNQSTEFLKANDIWAFSDSMGLDFRSGSPVPIKTSCSGNDVVATASDPVTGELLFYADRTNLYNAHHKKMPHGDSLLAGFTMQSVCIVPFINQPGKYYVFTLIGFQDANPVGLTYSVVDMSLDNGLGDVISTEKNIPLLAEKDSTGAPLDSVSTGMIAIPGNNCDVWLMTHTFGKSVFKALHITAEGIDTVPVVSTAGSLNANGVIVPFIFGSYLSGAYYRATMAVSPDRRHIAISSFDAFAGAFLGVGAVPDMQGVLVCKFDPATGVVSNAIEVENDLMVYGMAFSPDNSKLYLFDLSTYIAAALMNPGTGSGALLNQYDLTKFDSTSIAASKKVLKDSIYYSLYAAFQLYRDTIYFRLMESRGVNTINQPNLSGTACDIQWTSDNVENQSQSVSLQNEVVYSLPDTVYSSKDTLICKGWKNGIQLHPEVSSGEYQYRWNTGSSDSIISITESGTYWVTYNNGCHYKIDSFLMRGSDLHAVINVDEFTLGTTMHYDTYQWLLNGNIIPGATDSTYTVTQNGGYKVIVSVKNGCTDTSDVYDVTNYTGITDIHQLARSISIYPNPVKDILYINAPVPVNVTLASLEGRILRNATNAHQLSVKNLAAGIYLLNIKDRKGRRIKTEKIVKSE